MLYQIELRRNGLLPYEFSSEQMAHDYMLASFRSEQYRVVPTRRFK